MISMKGGLYLCPFFTHLLKNSFFCLSLSQLCIPIPYHTIKISDSYEGKILLVCWLPGCTVPSPLLCFDLACLFFPHLCWYVCWISTMHCMYCTYYEVVR